MQDITPVYKCYLYWASKTCNSEMIDLQRVTAPTATLLHTEKDNPAIFYTTQQ